MVKKDDPSQEMVYYQVPLAHSSLVHLHSSGGGGRCSADNGAARA